ncbi:TniQ family protein [Pseudomonas kielensis]|uniref:TniQ family protein n=1 Tax=Pseudomonas TaxID=286 RepID=UPI0014135483|nr:MULTISPECIES: TniQ family protein [Pseudomonas]NBB32523.1 transposase [Pseudomonas sp. BC115LW]WKL54907.1 TniQ family protein [Pseudomonas kielensis]
MSDLLFFPISMPDEMLHSRITRYHYLSGNRTEAETFHDLFDSTPFGVGMLPKQIEVLAAKLPGDRERNLDELISINTTFPVYRPFLGMRDDAEKGADGSIVSEVARVPRREVTVHGKARICLSCVQQDLLELGYAYWHRSHHVPGVMVCWRHGERLIHACPKCSHPFYRRYKLLPSLTEQCVCGWSPLKAAEGTKASDVEMKFAIFAHEVLQRNLPSVCSKVLSSCLVRQTRKRGFTHGELISTAKLIDSIRAKFGDEVLSQMDRAFDQGKLQTWIRFRVYKGLIDMPLARHLIIALHLFGSVEKFELSLRKELVLFSAANSGTPSKVKQGRPSKKERHRQKIETLMALCADINLEYLWANAYQATRWITEHDNSWLMAKLRAVKHEPISVEEASDPRDPSYADIIQARVDDLYRVTKDQKRVNIGNLLKLLPTRMSPIPAIRKQKFPLVTQMVERHLESVWHFRLRRLVWAIAEMRRLNLPLNTGSLKLVSTVPAQVFPLLFSFFEWDLEHFVKNGIGPETLLKSTGVLRNWEGPPGYDVILGGHAYRRRTRDVELSGPM